jgi:hypothetical protein
MEVLGYTTVELREHITSHPNWEMVKDGDWHLDHILPITAFVKHGIFDLKIINHLENLRPLGAWENMSKHDKYDPDEFRRWVESKGVKLASGLIFPDRLHT